MTALAFRSRAVMRARRVPLAVAGGVLVVMGGLGVWWPDLAALLTALAVAVAALVFLGRWALPVSVWVMSLTLLWVVFPLWSFRALVVAASVIAGIVSAVAVLTLMERAGLRR